MNANTHEKLGNYQLVKRLGIGGYSTVYLGEHLSLKTPAAIKVLHSRLFSDEALTSFMQEARLVEQLDHPHIVRLLEFGVEEHAPYLVFQYAPNGTVRQRYPKGSHISLPIIVQYVRQIAEALQYAHDLKVIHRDIKPENFLLGEDDEILLGDFGLAIPSHSSVGVLDRDRAGTAVYMAPEQSLGKSSRASDQYALGIVVYEWLCGRPPFQGADYEVLHQHIHETPASLQALEPTVPAPIEQVVMRALAKTPSERFPQIRDFAQALAAAYYQSLSQQAGVAAVPPLAAALEASSSGQEAADTLSRNQPQSPDEETTVHRDNPGGTQQQVEEHALGSESSLPTSVTLDEQATDPTMPTQKLAAVVDPAKQKRRMSRRSMVAAGILGLAALGGGSAAVWYSLGSSRSMPVLSVFSRARTTPGSTATKSPGGGTTAKSPGGDTPNAGGVDPNGTSAPSPNTGAPNTGAPNTGAPNTTTTKPLMVQISNAGALAQVRANSPANVVVTTSQAGIPVTVNVTYSNGNVQPLGSLTTDGNGNATFTWTVHTGPGKMPPNLSATLIAFATDANGQTVSSAPVNVNIMH